MTPSDSKHVLLFDELYSTGLVLNYTVSCDPSRCQLHEDLSQSTSDSRTVVLQSHVGTLDIGVLSGLKGVRHAISACYRALFDSRLRATQVRQPARTCPERICQHHSAQILWLEAAARSGYAARDLVDSGPASSSLFSCARVARPVEL